MLSSLSLRWRLLFLLLTGVSLCWLITLSWSYADARHQIDSLLDAQLIQTAETLLTLTRKHFHKKTGRNHKEEEDEEETEEENHENFFYYPIHPYQNLILFQIWNRDGKLLFRSTNTTPQPFTQQDGFAEVVLPYSPVNHFSSKEFSQKHHQHKEEEQLVYPVVSPAHPPHKTQSWRVFSQWDKHQNYRVSVAENHAFRNSLIHHMMWRLFLPAMAGLFLLTLLVWIAIDRGLLPLKMVAGQIATREPYCLENIIPENTPSEIHPLVHAINTLLNKVRHTMEAERRFTADAAHELRTPLAALTTQAQVALRARDEKERQHAISQLITSAHRTHRLIDQLLTLARLDPYGEEMPSCETDLATLAEEIGASYGNQALEKNLAFSLEATSTIMLGYPESLRILLRNLVDNAIRYTPSGGSVTVRIETHQKGIHLTVSDSGPGIPPDKRDRVFQRFYRLAGQEEKGHGLGLSIVARVVEQHHATIALEDARDVKEGGLCVRIIFTQPIG